MKIAISYKPNNGSWGGGNQFVKSLVQGASDEGYEIVYNLKQKDIDSDKDNTNTSYYYEYMR